MLTTVPSSGFVPPTSLVGRERELNDLADRLTRGSGRLVTLTGPGGVGKTRLALRVADLIGSEFADGVRIVSLAPITDPELVASAIAQEIGVRESVGVDLAAAVEADLRGRHRLLVLDNFEQVAAAAPLVARLLGAAPDLRILVTSRSLLRLSGEQHFPVPPLALPGNDLGSLEEVSGADSVRLFVQRAQAAQPSFVLTAATVGATAAICRRLDGLPLAIELAAARANLLPPAAMLARLDRPLPLLVRGPRDLPARQQTLRDAIGWSYDLLDPTEQALFRAVSVFVGGFDVASGEAVAEAVLGRGVAVFDELASLLDKSLLRHDPTAEGEPRFAMLETIREFGTEMLEAAGEATVIRERHAAVVGRLVDVVPAIDSAEQGAWLTRVEAEHDNVRAALAWLLQADDPAAAIRLAGGLGWFWFLGGHATEGRRWLDAALSRPGAAAVASGWRADALRAAGMIARELGEFAGAEARLEAALAFYREEGDRSGAAATLDALGVVALYRGGYERASGLLTESVALARGAGDGRTADAALGNLGLVALERGDLDRARLLFEEALAGRRAARDARGTAILLQNLGWVALHAGEFGQSVELSQEALVGYRRSADRRSVPQVLHTIGAAAISGGDREGGRAALAEGLVLAQELRDARLLTYYLEELALLAAMQGHGPVAVRAIGAVRAARAARGEHQSAVYVARFERWLAGLGRDLGAAFVPTLAAGTAAPFEEVLAEASAAALAATAAGGAGSAAAAGPGGVGDAGSVGRGEATRARSAAHGLSPREQEVLALLVAGRSNVGVAEALFISPRTAASHVGSILAKLGVESRAAAVARAIREGLA